MSHLHGRTSYNQRRFEPDDESDDFRPRQMSRTSSPTKQQQQQLNANHSKPRAKYEDDAGPSRPSLPVHQDPGGEEGGNWPPSIPAASMYAASATSRRQEHEKRPGDDSIPSTHAASATDRHQEDEERPVEPQHTVFGRAKTTPVLIPSHAQPGAFRERAAGRRDFDDDDMSYQTFQTTGGDEDAGPIFAVTAETIPEDGVDEGGGEPPQSRRRHYIVGGIALLVVIVGVVVGVVVGTKKDSTPAPSMAPTITPMPTAMPSLSPTNRPTLEGVWSPLGQTLTGTYENDRFGARSMDMNSNGTILVVSVIGANETEMGNRTGRVYSYQLSEEGPMREWTPLAQVLEGQVELDQFGREVSLSGDGLILAVSAPKSTVDERVRIGVVRTFQLVNSTWIPYGQPLVGQTAFDEFGTSVALSRDGNFLAIGAPLYALTDGERGDNAGQVRVFSMVGGLWTLVGGSLEGNQRNARFGSAVALSGNGTVLTVGANIHDGRWGEDTGRVVVYRYNQTANAWGPLGEEFEGSRAFDNCGFSVALSQDGTILAFGCEGSNFRKPGDSTTGHVRVFRLEEDLQWRQVGQNIVGERPGDKSGFAISLSADGTAVLIGAPNNNETLANETVILNAGHVRIFRQSVQGDRFFQIGSDINGENQEDFAGTTVAMSSDGTVVAVGSGGVDQPGRNNTGQVRVFDLLG